MKSNNSDPKGLVLLITEDGTVLEILYDSFNLFSKETESDQSFIECLKNDSVKKSFRLVESINDIGVAFDWEMYIGQEDDTSLFNFSGVKIEKGIILIGSPSPDDADSFLNGLMEMNNEQMNKLRLFMKKEREDNSDKNEFNLFDEMSELNNELANTQRELTKKTAELERMNEFKNQMMGVASHDLRNPLMVILNFADFLISDYQEEGIFTEKQYEMVKEIKGTSEYMIEIIEDMLDITSIESGNINLKKEPVNLVDLIDDVVSLSQFSANKKDISITTHLPDSPINKEIDARKFRQVLDNLLSNAVKYSNSGTEIQVGIEQFKKSEEVSIYVKDQGQGIPENELDILFEPYSDISVEATAGEKSTGLGLAIVKKIVEAHDGKIEVDSEVGSGSTFTIHIP